ncbi:MAG: hypothetical protein ACJ790_00300 [Myxococcaceae bacterium]
MRRILAAVFGALSLASAGVHSLSCGKPDSPAPVTSVPEVPTAVVPVAAQPPPDPALDACLHDGQYTLPWLSTSANGHTHWACLREDGNADVFTESPTHHPQLLGAINATSFAGACPARVHESLEDLFGGACITLDFADQNCPEATLSTEQRKVCLPPPGEKPGAPIELVLSYIDHRWTEVSPAECSARKLTLTDDEEPDPNLCFDDDPNSGSASMSTPPEAVCFVPEGAEAKAWRVHPGVFEPVAFSSLCE